MDKFCQGKDISTKVIISEYLKESKKIINIIIGIIHIFIKDCTSEETISHQEINNLIKGKSVEMFQALILKKINFLYRIPR